jgi:hypothetical protein
LAALIHEASFQYESIRATIELTAPQSTILREAMAELYLES